MTQAWKLPIGIQDFEKLRTGNYIYVDKTEYLLDMIETGSVYFLSRPRRFGKSLTISTFDALFSGKKELFEGLYAERFFDENFTPSPVIRLDMSKTVTNRGLKELEASMLLSVQENADRYDLETDSEVPSIAFRQLTKTLSKKFGKVVFLIDEYDKPILDCINEPEKAQEFRASLRNLYTQIKASDAETRFVFFTGISKFTKTGVFSAMNNLYDLSVDPKFSCMLGYTKDEIEAKFKPRIAEIADEIGCSSDELFVKIKEYYNGFSFDGKQFVYNPFSMLSFLKMGQFRNFWFESGSPSFIIDYIRKNNISVENYRGYVVMENFTDMNEIERAEPASFLFQAGYLTFKERFGEGYVLDYPNLEVLSATARLVASNLFGIREDFGGYGLYLKRAFDAGDIEETVACLNRLLAAIPYNLFSDTEKFYHSVLLTVMWGAGINTVAEVQTHKGRSDIVVMHRGINYVIELKIAEGEEAAKKAAEAALEQIEQKGYAQKYPTATRLGFGIDVKARQIHAVW